MPAANTTALAVDMAALPPRVQSQLQQGALVAKVLDNAAQGLKIQIGDGVLSLQTPVPQAKDWAVGQSLKLQLAAGHSGRGAMAMLQPLPAAATAIGTPSLQGNPAGAHALPVGAQGVAAGVQDHVAQGVGRSGAIPITASVLGDQGLRFDGMILAAGTRMQGHLLAAPTGSGAQALVSPPSTPARGIEQHSSPPNTMLPGAADKDAVVNRVLGKVQAQVAHVSSSLKTHLGVRPSTPAGGAMPQAMAAQPAGASAAGQNGVLAGRVVAVKPLHQPTVATPSVGAERAAVVVDTGQGRLLFETSRPPSVGASVQVQVDSIQRPASMQVQSGWQNINQQVQVLQQSAGGQASTPSAAVQAFLQELPQLGPRMTASVVQYLQAARTGDTRIWPGHSTLKALEKVGERGRTLALSVEKEIAEAQSLSRQESSTGDWRSYAVPFMMGGKIEKIQLYVRPYRDDDDATDGGNPETGERFVMDLELSRMGQVQLDGFYRKASRIFKLLIRSTQPFAVDLQQEIRQIFTANLAITGLGGGIDFQLVAAISSPVYPDPDQTKKTHRQSVYSGAFPSPEADVIV
jgi:hypothetical protein